MKDFKGVTHEQITLCYGHGVFELTICDGNENADAMFDFQTAISIRDHLTELIDKINSQ